MLHKGSETSTPKGIIITTVLLNTSAILGGFRHPNKLVLL